MMSYLNTVTLLGNLGKDPKVLKKTDKGVFVRLDLATTKKFRNDKKQLIESTQWHTICLNNGVGKFAETYLKKGDKVLITGELRNTKWKDENGVVKYSTAVFGKECKALSSKGVSKQAKDETEKVYEDVSDFPAEFV